MDNIKRLFNEKNRKKTIGIIAGIVAVIVLVIVIIFNPFANKNAKIKKQLENRLEELGRDYYSYYYPQYGDSDEARKEYVKSIAQSGVKIDLANAARIHTTEYENILAEFKNADGEPCDTSKSHIDIYPKEPYGINDYKISVELVCNFDGKSKVTTKKADSTTTTPTTTKAPTTTTKKKK